MCEKFETDFYNLEISSLDSKESLTETEIKDVAEELERGRRLKDERLNIKQFRAKDIKPLYDDKPDQTKLKYHRFICEENKKKSYPPCKHTGYISINRSILTNKEHTELLAKPKRRCENTRFNCYYVTRYLPNCTTRVASLAIPKKRRIIENLKAYSGRLTGDQIEKMTQLLSGKTITNIGSALTYWLEEIKQKRIAKSRIKKDTIKIQHKILVKKTQMAKYIIYQIYDTMKDFLMHIPERKLQDKEAVLSDVLLNAINSFIGEENMSHELKELYEQFLCHLSINLAIWMLNIVTASGFNEKEHYEMKTCKPQISQQQTTKLDDYPIDDYIQDVYSDQTLIEEATEEGGEENFEEISEE